MGPCERQFPVRPDRRFAARCGSRCTDGSRAHRHQIERHQVSYNQPVLPWYNIIPVCIVWYTLLLLFVGLSHSFYLTRAYTEHTESTICFWFAVIPFVSDLLSWGLLAIFPTRLSSSEWTRSSNVNPGFTVVLRFDLFFVCRVLWCHSWLLQMLVSWCRGDIMVSLWKGSLVRKTTPWRLSCDNFDNHVYDAISTKVHSNEERSRRGSLRVQVALWIQGRQPVADHHRRVHHQQAWPLHRWPWLDRRSPWSFSARKVAGIVFQHFYRRWQRVVSLIAGSSTYFLYRSRSTALNKASCLTPRPFSFSRYSLSLEQYSWYVLIVLKWSLQVWYLSTGRTFVGFCW